MSKMSKKNHHYFRTSIKKSSQLLFLAACAVFNSTQAAPLPDGTLLTITPGVASSVDFQCESGSCLGYEFAGGVIWRSISPGSDGGIVIGKNQVNAGREENGKLLVTGEIATSHLAGIAVSLATRPVTGVSTSVLTDSSLNIFDSASCSNEFCTGKTELGTLHAVTYSGAVTGELEVFGFGSDEACAVDSTRSPCTTNQINGVFVTNWTVNADGSYILDYSVPDYSADTGSQILVHLEGNISNIDTKVVFSDQAVNEKIDFTDLSNTDVNTGGGVAWIDANNDTYPDLFITRSGELAGNIFYRNDKKTLFEGQVVDSGFREITADAGLSSPEASNGVAVGDYDGDGCDDIFIANGLSTTITGVTDKARRNTLYRNNFCGSGDLTFTDVTLLANISEVDRSDAASFGDVNGDGYLDLYVGNNCGSNRFYLNNGNGSFTEMANQLGIDNSACTLATTLTDFDQDGDLDIYITNDFSAANSFGRNNESPDVIYENTGTVNGVPQFAAATSINLSDAENGMGIAVGDYDNDNDLDYYVSNYVFNCLEATTPGGDTSSCAREGGGLPHNNILNQNIGGANPLFNNTAILSNVNDMPVRIPGIGTGSLDNGGGGRVGWGAVFFDADNDGYLDLYKANGSIGSSDGFVGRQYSQPNRLFYNNQNGTFRNIAPLAGVDGAVCDSSLCTVPTSQSRGVAASDYDLDGDVDLFVTNSSVFSGLFSNVFHGGIPKLYRNDQSSGNNYIKINLRGLNPNHRGIGAKVFLSSSGGNQQMREIHAGTGHGSTHDFTVHFGTGSSLLVNTLKVEWPGGCVEELNSVMVNQSVDIFEANCNKTGNGIFRGRVIDSVTGSGIPDVLIVAIGSENGFANTDDNGFYAIENLVPDSYGVLAVVPDGYLTTEGNATFKTCDSGIRRELSSGVTLVENCTLDPVPTFTLSGVVTDSAGAALSGVEVRSLNGNTTMTLADGSYSLQVKNGGAYISPKSAGLTFTPFGKFIFMLSQSKTLDFTADP